MFILKAILWDLNVNFIVNGMGREKEKQKRMNGNKIKIISCLYFKFYIKQLLRR